MLPNAGLFLPETLHRQDRPASGHSETDSARLRYFQRKPGRAKEEARQTLVETASNENVGGTGAIEEYTSVTTALKFADFVSSSNKASAESHALAFLIHRVQHDLTEGSRLYLSPAVKNFLEAWPDRKSWIDAILVDMRRSLNDIGTYMDTFRVAGDDGGAIGLKRKFEWISGHQKRLQGKQQLLSTCHQSLVTAINIMQTVELCGVTNGTWQDPIYEAPVQPWVKYDNSQALRGPYSRREYRMSQKNLSLSSVLLSQAQESKETDSVNSIPAELPGSTPEDLARTNHTNISTFPRTRQTYIRSSSRRTYFNSNADHCLTQTSTNETADTKSSTNSLPIHPEHHSRRTAHSSFDHVRLPHRNVPAKTRVSLDSARPSSHPERLQTANAHEPRPRASTDILQPLPTLDEKTVERNDSATSTNDVVTVSQVAKRYSPTPVFIKRHVGRHRSLPSELPHVQSQSSLTEDLADWADWMIPLGVQSERLRSAEWDAESDLQSPSTSIASCPAVAQMSTPTPTVEGRPPDDNCKIDSSPVGTMDDNKLSSSQDDNHQTLFKTNRIRSAPHPDAAEQIERAASIQSGPSNVPRKPVPVVSKISADTSPQPLANNTQLPSPEPQQEESHNHPKPSVEQVDPSSTQSTPVTTQHTVSQASSIASTNITMPTSADAELSLLQQKLLHQSYVDIKPNPSSPQIPLVEVPHTPPQRSDKTPIVQTEPENTVASGSYVELAHALLQPSAVPRTGAVGNTATTTTTKPMSAQAKRRAAHQRRMEIAFGRAGTGAEG